MNSKPYLGFSQISQNVRSFFSEVGPQSRNILSDILGMKQGTLPIRYLGVPLISGKLSFSHCGPLIDRINARVNSWSSSQLSYGGRLQLIKSVLESIIRY